MNTFQVINFSILSVLPTDMIMASKSSIIEQEQRAYKVSFAVERFEQKHSQRHGSLCGSSACLFHLKQFESGDTKRLYEITTIDETWIYYSQPKSKEKSKCWLHPDEPRPKKPGPDFRVKKVMYAIAFDAFGPVAQICVQCIYWI